jgi:RimJ/RimL family protein N-acetyltransferase
VVELGYEVFASYRRRGYASEAVQGMMDWAGTEHEIHRFRVSISPTNEASLAMAEKLGFKQTGEQMDEVDGLEYVFELSLPE